MSNNRLTFQGLEELKRELQNLPEYLAEKARAIIDETTSAARSEVEAGYQQHNRTGELAGKTKSKTTRDGLHLAGEVRNSSPIAHIFENGTAARRTDAGANRGIMPPGNVFIPVMRRRRRRMYELLKGVVAEQGLQVSGDATA